MISNLRSLYSLIAFLLILNYCENKYRKITDPKYPFCALKQFDTIFNIGHIIYFYRCEQMWAFDPKLNGGAGALIHEYSPYIVIRQTCHDDMYVRDHYPVAVHLNVTAFSFQDLNCVKQDEDSNGKCRRSVREWNHFTFILCGKRMYAFEYDTRFKKKGDAVIDHPFEHSFNAFSYWYAVIGFFPLLNEVAEDFHFQNTQMDIKHVLFDPIRYYLYLAIKHADHYCITYSAMEKVLFDINNWPGSSNKTRLRLKWKRAHCFVGHVSGMFLLKKQAYIVGQVLYDNRLYTDQIYKLVANGESMVEFGALNVMNGNNSSEPQTVRRFFGCFDKKEDHFSRKKRSLPEHIETKPQMRKTIIERVANNVLIQIMVSVFVLVLIYKLVSTPFAIQLQHKIYNKLF